MKKWPILILIAACAHLAMIFYWYPKGYISVDESIYHLMAYSLSDYLFSHSQNAFELPVLFHGAPMIAKYPYLSTLIPSLFYPILNYDALFILNGISFWVCLYLTFLIGDNLFNNKQIAYLGAFLFGFTTFAWDYSFAAWPHLFSLCFALCAALLVLRSFKTGQLTYAFYAGLILGLGLGVRMDLVFLIPGLLLVIFLNTNTPFRISLYLLLGVLPGLLILAFVNYLKFDIFFPFLFHAGGLSTFLYHLQAVWIVIAAAALLILGRYFKASLIEHRRPMLYAFLFLIAA
ncbi:glycosyltransferase family 39 protein, partial [Oligoflexia bacterium]|nr:glycosyltransferase family 39 protein [Oligoflexia bacterium]